uniref:T-complex-associated-testis-expressed 1 n=1 Tax=Kryptolebias marmoratus TaxID=37003 RepID=A0A3Q3B646_KRYMA
THLTPSKGQRKMRRIIAENPNWSLVVVPSLSSMCLQSIVNNFEGLLSQLTPGQRDFIQEGLSPTLPLRVTANLIPDGVYWKRCCERRWDLCDVSRYGHSWRRMFFERHLENLIELFIPEVTEPKAVLDVLPFCKSYVRRLNVSQLLPPIKEPQGEKDGEENDLDLAIDSEHDEACAHHFDFGLVLRELTHLEELALVYRVKECGMNFEWKMFEMTKRDCESLAKALKSSRTLKLFRLHQSNVEDKKCRLLVKHLLDHPSLRELDLSHNLIGNGGARAIGKLLARSKLEVLNVCDNKIGELGAKAIARALSRNSTLSSLNLRLNLVRDEGGAAIGEALRSNTTLHHLNLGGNDMTWRAASALSDVLIENKTLRSINLSCNNLGKVGGKALAEAMSHNTTLTELNVLLTEVDEQNASFVSEVVCANQRSEHKKQRKTGSIKYP